MKKAAARRRKLHPIVAAVVLPVGKRLARMEALLLEMRHEQDVQLKELNRLEIRVETLVEHVKAARANRRKL